MPWYNDAKPTAMERVVAGVCYLTFGLAGLLYIILSPAMRSGQPPFFKFHFLQSIILGIIFMIVNWMMQAFTAIMAGLIPMIVSAGGAPILTIGGNVLDVLMKAFYLLVPYGMIWAFMGKYAEMPFISDVVRQNMR